MKFKFLLSVSLFFLVSVSGLFAQIVVSLPNGSESWPAGSQHNITWTITGFTSVQYTISYSSDNGASWNTIAMVPASPGSYAWTVPNTVSTKCLVSVAETKSNFDVSNACFAITGTTGIDVNEYKQNIVVYPNPASDFIAIQSNDRDDLTNVVLYSVLGNAVAQYTREELIQRNMKIEVSGFAAGTYSLMISTSLGIECKKLVIVD